METQAITLKRSRPADCPVLAAIDNLRAELADGQPGIPATAVVRLLIVEALTARKRWPVSAQTRADAPG